MQRWSSVILIVLFCLLRDALAYTEPIYEIVEEDAPIDDYEAARKLETSGRVFSKRDIEGNMPGVLRFGKRDSNNVQKKEMPGVLRFGKRNILDEKKSVPGVLRFGKRSDVLDKREMPGVLRFGKRGDYIEEVFDKRGEVPGVLRFGKRNVPGVLRFGKRSDFGEQYAGILLKKSVPGVLRFGRK